MRVLEIREQRTWWIKRFPFLKTIDEFDFSLQSLTRRLRGQSQPSL